MNSDFSHVLSSLRKMAILPALCLATGLVGCNKTEAPSNGDHTAKAASTDSLLKEGATAKGLTKDQGAETPTSDFSPSDKVCLALKLNGRPKTGIVKAKFYYDKELITETTVDVATLNKDVLFSVGETTNVGFSLTHEKPFPVGDKYRAETFFDDKPLATYKFNVVASGEGAHDKISEAPTDPKA